MASAVIALGVTICFTVTKIKDNRRKNRALINEAILSKDISHNMAISGGPITHHRYDDGMQVHVGDALLPLNEHNEDTK